MVISNDSIANAYGGSPPARCFQRFVAVHCSESEGGGVRYRIPKAGWNEKVEGYRQNVRGKRLEAKHSRLKVQGSNLDAGGLRPEAGCSTLKARAWKLQAKG